MSIDGFPDADGFVFVAGGIGISPCLSMLRTLADRGDRRPHLLVHGTSDLARAPFLEAVQELSGRLRLDVVHVLEHPPAGWTGETGVVDEAVLRRHVTTSGRRGCFVCGPPAMMDAVERALGKIGIPLGDIHSERFDLV